YAELPGPGEAVFPTGPGFGGLTPQITVTTRFDRASRIRPGMCSHSGARPMPGTPVARVIMPANSGPANGITRGRRGQWSSHDHDVVTVIDQSHWLLTARLYWLPAFRG